MDPRIYDGDDFAFYLAYKALSKDRQHIIRELIFKIAKGN